MYQHLLTNSIMTVGDWQCWLCTVRILEQPLQLLRTIFRIFMAVKIRVLLGRDAV